MRFVDVRTAETWCDYWILDSPTVSGSAQDSTSDYTLKAFWAVECPNLASMIPKLARLQDDLQHACLIGLLINQPERVLVRPIPRRSDIPVG